MSTGDLTGNFPFLPAVGANFFLPFLTVHLSHQLFARQGELSFQEIPQIR